MELSFAIDELTSSIRNVTSGEVFETIVSEIRVDQSKQIKKKNWSFDWKKELATQGLVVYKLCTAPNPLVLHGLISLAKANDHVFMNLIESAAFNIGKNKLYEGVAGNLVAFACKLSFEAGFDGVVAFVAKTQLIRHYEEQLGAKCFAGNRMFIDTPEASKLVKRYFKDFSYDQL